MSASTGAHAPFDIPVFSTLPKPELDLLLKRAQRRSYKTDETIFREGDPPAFVFYVASGDVNVSLSSEDRRINIGRVRTGQLLGIQAVFDDGPHFVAATVTAPTSVLAIPREDLLGALQRHPEVMFQLARILVKQSRNSQSSPARPAAA